MQRSLSSVHVLRDVARRDAKNFDGEVLGHGPWHIAGVDGEGNEDRGVAVFGVRAVLDGRKVNLRHSKFSVVRSSATTVEPASRPSIDGAGRLGLRNFTGQRCNAGRVFGSEAFKASSRRRQSPDSFSVGTRQGRRADQLGYPPVQNQSDPFLLHFAPSKVAANSGWHQ